MSIRQSTHDTNATSQVSIRLNAGPPAAATTTVLTNDATTLKVRDNVLVGTQPKRFMRVKVTAAP